MSRNRTYSSFLDSDSSALRFLGVVLSACFRPIFTATEKTNDTCECLLFRIILLLATKAIRNDRARESNAVDKLTGQSVRSGTGFPWETTSISLARLLARTFTALRPEERRKTSERSSGNRISVTGRPAG